MSEKSLLGGSPNNNYYFDSTLKRTTDWVVLCHVFSPWIINSIKANIACRYIIISIKIAYIYTWILVQYLDSIQTFS